MKRILTVVTLLTMGLGATPVAAQVTVVARTQDHLTGLEATSTMKVEGDQVAMDVLGGAADPRALSTVIYRGADRVVLVVEHGSRSVYEIDEHTAAAMEGRMQSMRRQVEDHLGGIPLDRLPPQAREKLQQAMEEMRRDPEPAAKPGGTFEPREKPPIVRTSDTGRFAGVACAYYERTEDREVRRYCLARLGDLAGGHEFAKGLVGMIGFFEDVMSGFQKTSGPLHANPFMETREFLEDGLFPVRVEVYGLGYEGRDNRVLKEETEVVSAHRHALDPAVFEPPAGYRRQPLFGDGE